MASPADREGRKAKLDLPKDTLPRAPAPAKNGTTSLRATFRRDRDPTRCIIAIRRALRRVSPCVTAARAAVLVAQARERRQRR
jgi:hypothetical protein